MWLCGLPRLRKKSRYQADGSQPNTAALKNLCQEESALQRGSGAEPSSIPAVDGVLDALPFPVTLVDAAASQHHPVLQQNDASRRFWGDAPLQTSPLEHLFKQGTDTTLQAVLEVLEAEGQWRGLLRVAGPVTLPAGETGLPASGAVLRPPDLAAAPPFYSSPPASPFATVQAIQQAEAFPLMPVPASSLRRRPPPFLDSDPSRPDLLPLLSAPLPLPPLPPFRPCRAHGSSPDPAGPLMGLGLGCRADGRYSSTGPSGSDAAAAWSRAMTPESSACTPITTDTRLTDPASSAPWHKLDWPAPALASSSMGTTGMTLPASEDRCLTTGQLSIGAPPSLPLGGRARAHASSLGGASTGPVCDGAETAPGSAYNSSASLRRPWSTAAFRRASCGPSLDALQQQRERQQLAMLEGLRSSAWATILHDARSPKSTCQGSADGSGTADSLLRKDSERTQDCIAAPASSLGSSGLFGHRICGSAARSTAAVARGMLRGPSQRHASEGLSRTVEEGPEGGAVGLHAAESIEAGTSPSGQAGAMLRLIGMAMATAGARPPPTSPLSSSPPCDLAAALRAAALPGSCSRPAAQHCPGGQAAGSPRGMSGPSPLLAPLGGVLVEAPDTAHLHPSFWRGSEPPALPSQTRRSASSTAPLAAMGPSVPPPAAASTLHLATPPFQSSAAAPAPDLAAPAPSSDDGTVPLGVAPKASSTGFVDVPSGAPGTASERRVSIASLLHSTMGARGSTSSFVTIGPACGAAADAAASRHAQASRQGARELPLEASLLLSSLTLMEAPGPPSCGSNGTASSPTLLAPSVAPVVGPVQRGRGAPVAGGSHRLQEQEPEPQGHVAMGGQLPAILLEPRGAEPSRSRDARAGAALPGHAVNSGPQPGPTCLWHEVWLRRFVHPQLQHPVILIVQNDVSSRIWAERQLARVVAAEHTLLEGIFPHHVIQHIATAAAEAAEDSAEGHALGPAGQGPAAGPVDPHLPAIRGDTFLHLATSHKALTVLFCDIQGFTPMCKEVPPMAVMAFLNDLFTRLDGLLGQYGVYKVETIGDCYVAAGGLMKEDEQTGAVTVRSDDVDPQHAHRTVQFAKALLRAAAGVTLPTTGQPVRLRVGIHSGPAMSGVVGTRMPRFCLFGDTMNTASRMESTGEPGAIHVSEATRDLVPGEAWLATGGVEVKGKGVMDTFLLRPSH